MHETESFLPSLILFLAAAVIAVPVFKRIGLGAILGYLAAGVAIGPSGFRLFTDTAAILHIAELGVVMLLFVIGLELQLPRLIAMRKDIFGLGAIQLVSCSIALGLAGAVLGLSPLGAAATGVALSLSATSIGLQVLNERGELQSSYGQRSFAVLLFQDMSIVPILAIIPLLAIRHGADDGTTADMVVSGAVMVGAIVAVILAGRYLLNPLFRILANTGAQEVMTASALLLVLGTALLMQWAGMSMALGAFLAGVLLAESNFRHELEADIEPFRGLLLGLFFMGVGMSIDGGLVLAYWPILLSLAVAMVAVKAAIITGLFRYWGMTPRDAVRGGAVLSPASEFSFVVIPVAAASGFLTAEQSSLVQTLAATTMLTGPLLMIGLEQWLKRVRGPAPAIEEDFADAHGLALMIGFGRFGQVAAQVLRTQGVQTTIIDNDVEMIEVAARFGSKVYFGDGTRLDVLRAAGAAEARVICVMVDDRAAAVRIVEMAKAEFPLARVLARAFDRQHALALLEAGVDGFMRETYESALAFGRQTLDALGVGDEEADEVIADVRERDLARLKAQQQGGLLAGMDLINTRRALRPEPLDRPSQVGVTLNPDAVRAVEAAKEEEEEAG
jgi:CPA2 family monovalent cation:H+ antiporter-2/glutathione-regulated potassium-efflux system protein KefB